MLVVRNRNTCTKRKVELNDPSAKPMSDLLAMTRVISRFYVCAQEVFTLLFYCFKLFCV